MVVYGLSLPTMPGQPFGAGMFPSLVGAGLCIAGGVLLVRKVEPTGAALIALGGWGRSPSHVANFFLTIACIVAFAFGIRQVGFAVLTFATVAILQWRLGQPLWRSLLYAALVAILFQIVFATLMRVPLPPGILQGLIY